MSRAMIIKALDVLIEWVETGRFPREELAVRWRVVGLAIAAFWILVSLVALALWAADRGNLVG